LSLGLETFPRLPVIEDDRETISLAYAKLEHHILKQMGHKVGARSDCTDLGNPTNVKNLIRALTIFGVLIVLKGIASGKRVEAHIIMSRY